MSPARRLSATVLAGATLLSAALFAGAPAGASVARTAATKTVTLKGIAFHPASLRVSRGTSVKFVWQDGKIPHNVTSKGPAKFKSAGTRTSGTYAVKFTKAGTYKYSCTIHFGMNGKVVVR